MLKLKQAYSQQEGDMQLSETVGEGQEEAERLLAVTRCLHCPGSIRPRRTHVNRLQATLHSLSTPFLVKQVKGRVNNIFGAFITEISEKVG